MADVNAIHEVFPYLCVRNTNEAVAFYEKAFGAKFKYRLVEPSGRVGHAEIELGPITLMLSDEYPEMGVLAPKAEQPEDDDHSSPCRRLRCAREACRRRGRDAGDAARRSVLRRALTPGKSDPFGHAWLLGHSIEKVTPEEMQRRYTQVMEDETSADSRRFRNGIRVRCRSWSCRSNGRVSILWVNRGGRA